MAKHALIITVVKNDSAGGIAMLSQEFDTKELAISAKQEYDNQMHWNSSTSLYTIVVQVENPEQNQSRGPN